MGRDHRVEVLPERAFLSIRKKVWRRIGPPMGLEVPAAKVKLAQAS